MTCLLDLQILEKLKAHEDPSTSLGAFLQLNELSEEEDEEDELLKPGAFRARLSFHFVVNVVSSPCFAISNEDTVCCSLKKQTSSNDFEFQSRFDGRSVSS